MRRRLRASLVEAGSVPVLAAVALLIANDHLLKAMFHNAITGKLSDVAICFLLPLLLSAALGALTTLRVEARLWIGAAVGGAVFALMEMSDTAGDLFRRALAIAGVDGGGLTRDPTDLLALLVVPLAVAAGRRRARGRPLHPRLATAAGAAAMIAGSLGLVATSGPALALCDHYTAPVVFQADPGCGPGGLIVVDADSFRGGLAISNGEAVGLPAPGASGTADERQGQYNGGSCPFTYAAGGWQVTVGSCSNNVVTTADAGTTTGGDAGDGGGGSPRDAGDASAAQDASATRDASGAGDASGVGDASTAGDASAPRDTSVLRDASVLGDAGDGGAGDGGAGDGGNSSGGGGAQVTCPSTHRVCKAALDSGVLFLSCTRGNEQVPFCRSRLTVMP